MPKKKRGHDEMRESDGAPSLTAKAKGEGKKGLTVVAAGRATNRKNARDFDHHADKVDDDEEDEDDIPRASLKKLRAASELRRTQLEVSLPLSSPSFPSQNCACVLCAHRWFRRFSQRCFLMFSFFPIGHALAEAGAQS